jgi:MFS family permease
MPTSVASPKTRWWIPVALAFTVFINYLDRNNLSLALPRIAQEFGWSDREIGSKGELLLAAFFLSYGLSNILLSPVAERLGPKRSVMLAIAAFSLVTLLSAPLGASLVALIVLRLLLGLAEGVHIPMLSAITSYQFGATERSRANAIWGGGILLSTAIAPLLIVPLIHSLGWRSTFAVLGVGGLVLSIPLVYLFVPNDPLPKTRSKFSDKPIAHVPSTRHSIHYSRDHRFWLAVVAGSLNAFCAFGLLNWLPTYFNRARGINFEQLGWTLTVVFAAGILGMAVMAYLGDRLQHRTRLAAIGFLLAGGMVYLASTSTRLEFLVLFFAIAVFCQSAYGAQEYAIVQHILPDDRVGAGTGLYNGLSVLIGGVGGSLIPGAIVAATGSFDAGIFSIIVGAGCASLVLFALARLIRY